MDKCWANIQSLRNKSSTCVQDPRPADAVSLQAGQSGNDVFMIQYEGNSAVLKTYRVSDDTGSANEDSRPFRDIYTSCVMSGTVGFPLMYTMGCTHIDNVRHIFMITERAHGKPLVDINPLTLSLQQMKAILLVLLHIMSVAKQKLGKSFMHNDLHPGNILIDINQKFPLSTLNINGVEIEGGDWPLVTLIDFDMTVTSKFDNNIRHNLPRMSNVLFQWFQHIRPESAISIQDFLTKWAQGMSMNSTIGIVQRLASKSRTNYDLANWNFYFASFLMIRDIQQKKEQIPEIGQYFDAVKCNGLTECATRVGNFEMIEPIGAQIIADGIEVVMNKIGAPVRLFHLPIIKDIRDANDELKSMNKKSIIKEVVANFKIIFGGSEHNLIFPPACTKDKNNNELMVDLVIKEANISTEIGSKRVLISFGNDGLVLRNIKSNSYPILSTLVNFFTFMIKVNGVTIEMNPDESTTYVLDTSPPLYGLGTITQENAPFDVGAMRQMIETCVLPALFTNKALLKNTLVEFHMKMFNQEYISVTTPIRKLDWSRLMKLRTDLEKSLVKKAFKNGLKIIRKRKDI